MLTVRVPLTFRKRGGRRQVIAPDVGATVVPTRADPTLVKALARAFRWRKMLESGRYGSVAEMAAAEKIAESYVSRIVRLTLLAPDIVEAILDGRQRVEITLRALMEPFPVGWEEQRAEAVDGRIKRASTFSEAPRSAQAP